MVLPDISTLNLNGTAPKPTLNHADMKDNPPDDRDLRKLKAYAKSLPYTTEPLSKMMEMLDFIVLRIVQSVEAKDFEVGLLQWDSMLY